MHNMQQMYSANDPVKEVQGQYSSYAQPTTQPPPQQQFSMNLPNNGVGGYSTTDTMTMASVVNNMNIPATGANTNLTPMHPTGSLPSSNTVKRRNLCSKCFPNANLHSFGLGFAALILTSSLFLCIYILASTDWIYMFPSQSMLTHMGIWWECIEGRCGRTNWLRFQGCYEGKRHGYYVTGSFIIIAMFFILMALLCLYKVFTVGVKGCGKIRKLGAAFCCLAGMFLLGAFLAFLIVNRTSLNCANTGLLLTKLCDGCIWGKCFWLCLTVGVFLLITSSVFWCCMQDHRPEDEAYTKLKQEIATLKQDQARNIAPPPPPLAPPAPQTYQPTPEEEARKQAVQDQRVRQLIEEYHLAHPCSAIQPPVPVVRVVDTSSSSSSSSPKKKKKKKHSKSHTSSAKLRPTIGAEVKWLDDDHGNRDNVAVVHEVKEGGPVALAHIVANDIIHAWNGSVVDSKAKLSEKIKSAQVGERITLTIDRPKYGSFDVDVTIGGTSKEKSKTKHVSSANQIQYHHEQSYSP